MSYQVILKPLYHREQECIGIYFDINFKINGALRKTNVVKYSATNKCWYAPLNKENYNKIYFALIELATFENSALYKYLADKKKIPVLQESALVEVKSAKPFIPVPLKSLNNLTKYGNGKIHDINGQKDKGKPIVEDIYIEIWVEDNGKIENWTH